MKSHIDVTLLKEQCPLPDLMRLVGLGRYAKSSAPSPFRQDNNASWGIFEYKGSWYFKDFSTDQSGDEIRFLACLLKLDEKKDFKELIEIYQHIADQMQLSPPVLLQDPKPSHPVEIELQKPSCSLFSPGTREQLATLSACRGLSIEGLQWAQQRGVLVFGRWYGVEVYGVRDCSGRVMEIRKLNGTLFEAIGGLSARKSHAIKGSQKKWPVGIQEAADRTMIVLVEGIPDLLAAHQVLIEENRQEDVAPVGMLCASVSISDDALPFFKGKHVRLFPHADASGVKAARKWSQQLKAAGVAKLDFYDFARLKTTPDERVKDLCELIGWRKCHPEYERKLLI
ncbi:MAG: toprim domain-containing protein [Verrucomicrobiota bacterium]